MQLGEFIVSNWLLFLTLVFILAMLALAYFGPGVIKSVGTAEAIQLMNQKDAVVVDVRTDSEYQAGHIINSLHIPLDTLGDNAPKLQDYKNNSLIIVCRTGSRSAHTASKLKKLGFEQVQNLSGGMSAWGSANLPTSTVSTKKSKLKKTTKKSKPKVPVQAITDDSRKVVVYTSSEFPFSPRAIELLDAKDVGFTEICVDTHPEKREEMEQRSSRSSVPQIFIGDHCVGDCDDMYALEDSNQLDDMLGLASKTEQKQMEQQESAV